MTAPVSLTEAKLFLRVDGDDEDALIVGLVGAAAREIEKIYGVVPVQREDVAFGFDWFSSTIRLPLKPIDLQSISITYLDPTGEEQTFEDFRAFERDEWIWLQPKVGTRWPTPASVAGAITIKATVGHDDDVPDDINLGAQILINHWYLRPESEDMPPSADRILDHYRFKRI